MAKSAHYLYHTPLSVFRPSLLFSARISTALSGWIFVKFGKGTCNKICWESPNLVTIEREKNNGHFI